jgi:GMP synthase-like glutamine amidotransferase
MNAPLAVSRGSALLAPSDVLPPGVALGPRLVDPAPAVRRSAVVLGPDPDHPTTPLIHALLLHGLDAITVPVDGREPRPDPSSARLAILVGKDRLTDTRARGRLDRDIEWIRRADDAGTAVLGIGHGARVLALALGGEVEPAERPLRGWAMVDTVVPHVIAGGPWLTWQHDVITLPPHAELLAHNRFGPQAFRVGRHLGVQFHPEATPEVLATWAAGDDARTAGHDLRAAGSDAQAVTPLNRIVRDPAAATICTQRLLSSFIGDI